ncbi:TIGR02680 family protein [Bradyrhizobium elkanii]|uniref:TIGR02680 family protein n=1 Tax=Bradyrhizobium elkanii TaxID=29448 RepID=A0A4U6RS77_BRAEL|nr:TIGR02680 family protein [Bradyrhizobium elkanii]TKV77657.1 TIGR02680 family protein [Bradyrhizobium elkanii]
MNERPTSFAATSERPALPIPTRERWQPLRLGLVEMFQYDSEEFWFRDGHLLLRGNNGTGKSKVLSLTLPFLFDGQLKPSRIEPDGDNGKKMSWNLLMNSYDRRVGYSWIEFGRLGNDGKPHYLTLGAGLSAVASRPNVESWFFVLDDADKPTRINHDLWLMSEQRVVLTRERLREAIESRGQVFETAANYRRAVDERLFHLGSRRYDALMDTLIQLRQPQLSKKPDETALSNALTEALPPLAPELLADVAEAFGQLEEDRQQLKEYEALAEAVDRFDEKYRNYAGTQSRRQARTLRQAQTEFDNASRSRGEAQGRLEKALAGEAEARRVRDAAEIEFKRGQSRLETLRSGPGMEDANRLESAETDMNARRRALSNAETATEAARRRLKNSEGDTAFAAERAQQIERRVAGLRRETAGCADGAGVSSQHADNPIAKLETGRLAALAPHAFEKASSDLRALVSDRNEEIASLRRRDAEVTAAEFLNEQRRRLRDESQDAADAAAERRETADVGVEREGQSLIDAWERCFAGLRHNLVALDDRFAVLASLAEWVLAPDDVNPARALLQVAQQQTSERLATIRVELDSRRRGLLSERKDLDDERDRLEGGVDSEPPRPHTRDGESRAAREGAPLWRIVDFRAGVTVSQRAGLEAALEAAGLLDAWISPDGRLQSADGDIPIHDTQMLQRRQHFPSLGDWLIADVPSGAGVPPATVERILHGIACADEELAELESWVAPDGRFRLGALGGAWTKPEAVYIGYSARAAARSRRLAEISERLAAIAGEVADLDADSDRLVRDQSEAAEEWRRAPTDDALRLAHLAAATAAREATSARQRLADATIQHQASEEALTAARQRRASDAIDLRLPAAPSELEAVEAALRRYQTTSAHLTQAVAEMRVALPDLERQRVREGEARDAAAAQERLLSTTKVEAEQAAARFDVLRNAIGARVEELRRQLNEARESLDAAETALDKAEDVLRTSGEARAVAHEQVTTATGVFEQRSEARTEAISRFQQFSATGLLTAAIPTIVLPDMAAPWTIDPALGLARRAEQALSTLDDKDEAWARIQKQISVGLTELQTALSALGHLALSEQNDWGLIVHVVYQNRPERPDRLAARLAEEIAQRSELLTAREREVLEDHLQEEIASEVQRLLQAAESRRDLINKELHSRPTSTGVRYRLTWPTLTEDEGAPVGLEAARKRLLNVNADLWSTEDRKVVGAMLRQRITAERERADSGAGKDSAGPLIEQLARALDYRRWHRFRVERWQDGTWRKLSGPASSGERALGLTVPLFAAIASFYTQGSYQHAPRLMLLDEAFAGIDDAARAHCMGLIREFDLDFVITSEREWACYAELPGVAICQLQRREGIDAVFVSRWSWDGRAKVREGDPDRRFALS